MNATADNAANRRGLLLAVSRLVLESSTADAALSRAVFEAIREHLRADVFFNYRTAGDGLALVAQVGIADEATASIQRLRMGQAFCGMVAATREPVAADVERINRDPAGALVRAMGVRAYVCHPLLGRGGRVLGTFSVGSIERDAFDLEEIELLQSVCHFLALAWDRQDAEHAVRQGEERLRLALESADTGLWEWDLRTDGVTWSTECYRILGLAQGTFDGTGAAFFRLVHPEDRERVGHTVRGAIDRRELYECEFRIVRPTGEIAWVANRGRASLDSDGQPVQVLGTITDVSARKRGEAALRASEAFAQHLADVAPSILYVYDLNEQRNVWGNREMVTVLGYTRDEVEALSGRLLQTLIHPDDLPRYALHAERLRSLTDGEAAELEYRMRHANGSWRWLVSRDMVYQRDQLGRVVQIVGAALDVTARAQSEERLRQTADSFRQLVEQSPFGVYTVDADFRVAQISHGARRAFANVQPVVGRDFGEVMRVLWPEPAATEFVDLFRRTLETGVPYQAPTLVERRADLNEVEAYDWKIERVILPDGRYGIVCHFYDLSERQRLEVALRESESFYRQTLESIPGMVFTNTPDGACDYVSEPWVTFTGVPAVEHLGSGWVQVLHPDDRARAFAAWRAAVEGRGSYDLEYRVKRHDGKFEWFKVRGRAIRDADGRVARWFGAAVNIDDLKATEAALAARERELQTLADNTPDILSRFDRELRHVFVNTAIAAATGAPVDAFLGKTNSEVGMPSDLCARWDAALRSVFATGCRSTLDFERGTPRGVRHYSTQLVPELGPDGTVEFVLGVTRDVTEQRRYQKTLEEQDRRKNEFLATLAHELRNPLAPLRHGVAILHASGVLPANGVATKAVGIMDRQLVHLVQLVDDLLDMSRVSQGKIALRLQRVSLREAIDAAVEACRPSIEGKGHALILDVTPEPLVVNGDLTRLVQIVSNLLTNACKYSDPGGRITITANRESGEAVMRVKDLGVGLAPDIIPTLWDLFTQVRDTLDKAQGGLGIGLSLVKKLVELHGGSVSAESPGLGLGSTFTVRLPLSLRAEMPRTPPATNDGASAFVGRRVLVVDDNADGALTLAMTLELMGHETNVAHSGFAALEAARTFRPEVIFLDIGLPDIDGHETARRLRADPGTSEVMLVALTGWGSDEDRRRSAESGFDVHLTKPVEPSALGRLMARLKDEPHAEGGEGPTVPSADSRGA